MNPAEKAQAMRELNPFVRLRRGDGSTFTSVRDCERPTGNERYRWVHEVVGKAISFTMGDWGYAECEAAWDAYMYALDNGESEDWIHTHADSQVDVYTKELYQWAADYCLTSLFAEAEERADEFAVDKQTVLERLSSIQYCAIGLICNEMQAAIDDHFDTESEES